MRYGDMIGRGIEALRGGAAVPFKHLLVDECQDSSAAIGQLVKALSKRIKTVMVLGDPRQAIFGFAGASPMRLNRLLEVPASTPLPSATGSYRFTLRWPTPSFARTTLSPPRWWDVVCAGRYSK